MRVLLCAVRPALSVPQPVRRSLVGRAATLALAALAYASSADAAAGDYAVKRKFVIGGEGGWDYLTYDESAHRLFVSRGTHVHVVDPDKGTVVGDIADTPGVHGIALAQDLGKGFISNGRDNSVTVFDLKTLETLARIRTGGENPDFIAYDPVSQRVFAFNGRSHSASVVDPVGMKLITTIALDGKPESAVTDGKGIIFVNIEDKNEITALDAANAVVVSTRPVAGCEEPAALAMDRERRRLFVGCQNKMLAVLDADSGKRVAALPIGAGVDASAFDPGTKLAFSSQDDGTLTVIEERGADSYAVVQNVITQKGARTLALNPRNHDIYLITAEFDAVPAKGQQRARRDLKPGTFTLIVVGTGK